MIDDINHEILLNHLDQINALGGVLAQIAIEDWEDPNGMAFQIGEQLCGICEEIYRDTGTRAEFNAQHIPPEEFREALEAAEKLAEES